MGERPYESLDREQLSAALMRKRQLIAAEQADYYELIREVDRRPGFVPRARPGSEAVTFLRSLGVDSPAEEVRIARTLGELPQFEKAFASGEATRGQVATAEQAVRKIREVRPGALDAATMTELDARLTDAARDLTRSEYAHVVAYAAQVLTHDAEDTSDELQLERRKLVLWRESNGWTGIEGYLPPDIAAPVWAAMDRWAKPQPAKRHSDQDILPIHDRRTNGQRQADALGQALWVALGAATTTEPDRPHVVIHVRPDSPIAECDRTGPISKAWVAKFLCDATVDELRKDRRGGDLDLGRKARTAPGPLRRALIGRHRTCVIPNCTVPASWADAHHVQWWAKSGPTNVSNMAMLCGPHHAAVHAETWQVEMRNGIPWAKPPTWLDPEQRWRRNTYEDHRDSLEQFVLDLDRCNEDTG